MSKHHQASRRRSYGRRLHELHERASRQELDDRELRPRPAGAAGPEEPRPVADRWQAVTPAWGGLG